MLKIVLVNLLISSSLFLNAQQDIKAYVQQHAVTIASIEPDSSNYADLDAIGTAIGDSRIVMLGEQDHGDAPAFLAKTRLIKYLHEKKGFNVVAFESDFFALNYGWDRLNKSEMAIDTFLRKNIFNIWTKCDACRDLFYKTIPGSYKTANPIIVSGFDCQMYLRYSSAMLAKTFDSVLQKLQLPITRKPDYLSHTLALVDSMTHLSFLQKSNVFYDSLLVELNNIKIELDASTATNDYWRLIMDSFINTVIEMRYMNTDHFKGFNARDRQMTSNLNWLSTIKFPNEKIIVWAHNYHISKYAGHYDDRLLNYAMPMGTAFTNDSAQMKNTYVIGFTSYEGTAGRIGSIPFNVEKPGSNSIENWFDANTAFAFVDFKPYKLLYPDNKSNFKMKASVKGIHKNHNGQWAKIFDGVFYIRSMYPCREIH